MILNCKHCDLPVVQGDLVSGKLIIDDTRDKPKGTIVKNKSNDPTKWTAVCSVCQSEGRK